MHFSHLISGTADIGSGRTTMRPTGSAHSSLPLLPSLLLATSILSPVCTATASGSSGCGLSLASAQALGSVTSISVPPTSDYDKTRSYLVYIPTSYDINVPSPLILSFHGGTQTALAQLQLDGFTNTTGVGGADNTIVVYPQGVNDIWQGVPGATVNDTQFTTRIIAEVEASYCINKAQIYAAGKSDGGGFVNVLACDATLSQKIAAFAPVSGAFYIDTQPCNPATVSIPCDAGRDNIPIIEFHGGEDSTIEYLGQADRNGECIPAIPHWVQEWASRDGLSLKNTSTKLDSDTTTYTYGSGTDAGLVTHVYDKNIGHDWPSTVANYDNTQTGHNLASFNATPIILKFFAKYSLATDGVLACLASS